MASKLSYLVGALDKALYRGGLRSTRGRSKPHFLGIGAQKAGTTWLHTNLRHHPQLFLPEAKELHYFDWFYHRTVGSYLRNFRDAGSRVAGEITPSYCALPPKRIAWVHRLLPDAKLIFILRNPIDRAWSAAVMDLAKRQDRAPQDVPDREYLAHFRSAASVSRGDYLGNLDRWLEHYPRERLLVEFFEDIADSPQALLTRVFRFLGVDPEVDWKDFPYAQIIHQGARRQGIPETLRAALEVQYRDPLQALHERFGARVAHWSLES